jgi:acyl carrier protein
MTDREVLDLITAAIKRIAPQKAHALEGADLEQLTLSALGLDSITIMELITQIETATGVMFADHELVGINRMMELVRLIQLKKGKKA